MSMSVSLVKRFSVLACVLMLPLSMFGFCLIWLVNDVSSAFLTYLWFFMPLIILSLLIVGGVCGRREMTLALCGVGLALFLFYAVVTCASLYAVNTGLLPLPTWD